MKSDRTCPDCGAVYPIWEYGVLYAPRTRETTGWLKVQCPKCWSVGGIHREADAMRDELERLTKAKEEIRMKISEVKKVLNAIGRNAVLEEG